MKLLTVPQNERKLFRSRVALIALAFAVVFSALGTRLWYLQVLKHEEYQKYSQGNRIRLRPEPGLRGVIKDRYGKVLAENRPAYHLQFVWEDAPYPERTLRDLAQKFDWQLSDLQAIADDAQRAPFRPVRLRQHLSAEQANYLQTHQSWFPGTSIEIEAARFYPYGPTAAHVLGYVSLTRKQTGELPQRQRRSARIEGRSGIERAYNAELTGVDGGRQVEVDYIGRELRTIGPAIPSVPGTPLQLTLDLELQQAVEQAMDNQTGAVIVMNPRNGEVLALGSFPAYDPNWFVDGISYELWQSLLSDPDNPLENKVLQGAYPPGSIYKLLTGYAALDAGLVDATTEHVCNGYHYISGRRAPFKCWKAGGHGAVTIQTAIRGSCNVFFYKVGMELGVDRLAQYARMMMFGQPIELGLGPERGGLVPDSAWKRQAFQEPWYPGETPSVAIGQGFVSATPLQVINFVNLIANDGVWHPPKLVQEVATEPPKRQGPALKPEYLAQLRAGMVAVVNDPDGGTANVVQIDNFTVAGKTATSQIISHQTRSALTREEREQRQYQNHAWFAGFAPAENPEISVLVLVEHGRAGSRTAAPTARKIFEFYLQNRYSADATAGLQPEPMHEPAFSQQLSNAFLRP
jgi:penicillin-binding protein 2